MPSFPPYFTEIEEILGCKDVMNLSEKTEVVESSIFKTDQRKRKHKNIGRRKLYMVSI